MTTDEVYSAMLEAAQREGFKIWNLDGRKTVPPVDYVRATRLCTDRNDVVILCLTAYPDDGRDTASIIVTFDMALAGDRAISAHVSDASDEWNKNAARDGFPLVAKAA